MSKINQILQQWPTRTVITTDWLVKKGVSRQLVGSYKKNGWLEQVGMGAYKRPNENLDLFGGLYALQKLQKLPIHVGGITALEHYGYSHYINISSKYDKIVLWKPSDVRVPSWFRKYDWERNLQIRSAKLFDKRVYKLTEKEIDGIVISVSVPEQAILEYLFDIPKYESFDEANYIMEGLVSLRPDVLQSLLEKCKSIKVKRLFLFLAEVYNHSWVERLDISQIDLGSGKREIIKGGKLVKKYEIVVPEISREDQ